MISAQRDYGDRPLVYIATGTFGNEETRRCEVERGPNDSFGLKPWATVDQLIEQLRSKDLNHKPSLQDAVFWARQGLPHYTADYLNGAAISEKEKAVILMLSFESMALRKKDIAVSFCGIKGSDLGYFAEAKEAEKIADRLRAIAISP